MFGILLNWEQTMITGVLLVMIMSPGSAELSAGWWIEQERSPAVEYQIVRVKVSHPTWLLKMKALIRNRRILFMRVLILATSIGLQAWLAFFKLTIKLLLGPTPTPSQISAQWLIPINPHTNLEVGLRLAISSPAVYDFQAYDRHNRTIIAVPSHYFLQATSSREIVNNYEQLHLITSDNSH